MLFTDTLVYMDMRWRAAHEELFALQYNEFYCNTRTLQLCMEGENDPAVLLRLLTGDNAGSSNETSTTSLVSPAISPTERLVWLHCRALVTTRMKEIKDNKEVVAMDHRLINETGRAVLDASKFSNAMDL